MSHIKALAPALAALGVLGGLLGFGLSDSGAATAKADGVCVGWGLVGVSWNGGSNCGGGNWNGGNNWNNCNWNNCGNPGIPASPAGNWNWDGWNWVPPYPPPFSAPNVNWYWDGWNWCRV